MRSHLMFVAALLLPGIVLQAETAAERWYFVGAGRLVGARTANGVVPVTSDVRVFRPGWLGYASLGTWSVKKSKPEPDPAQGIRKWISESELEPGRLITIEETAVEQGDGALDLNVNVIVPKEVPVQAAHFVVELPVSMYQGGQVRFVADNGEASCVFPDAVPKEPRFLSSNLVKRVVMQAPANGPCVEVVFPVARQVVIQDGRYWGGTVYTMYTPVSSNVQGFSALQTKLACSWEPDRRPVTLRLGGAAGKTCFDGMGGNFCFALDSPVTEQTVRQLEPAWARVEMKADEWEPDNDDPNAANIDWPRFEAVDKPGSQVRRCLEFGARLQQLHVPMCLSIWYLPEWLYRDPGRGKEVHGRVVNRDKWPELAECVISYIQYAARKYGWEPALFSFNESDHGVRVKFTSDEYRDAMRFLARQFHDAGVKTRLLLGDTTRPGALVEYVRPALLDRDVTAWAGAIGFHSWGGATVEEYHQIRQLADDLKLPLLVSETGFDSSAWQTPWVFESWYYAQADLRRIQELLIHTRPQGTMYWEYTADYSLFKKTMKNGALEPTQRFWFMKQYLLTPRPARFLDATSDRDDVLCVAFEAVDAGRAGEIVLHVANFGATRSVRLTGLPSGMSRMGRYRTGPDESLRDREPVLVSRGASEFDLPEQTLTTLLGKTD